MQRSYAIIAKFEGTSCRRALKYCSKQLTRTLLQGPLAALLFLLFLDWLAPKQENESFPYPYWTATEDSTQAVANIWRLRIYSFCREQVNGKQLAFTPALLRLLILI